MRTKSSQRSNEVPSSDQGRNLCAHDNSEGKEDKRTQTLLNPAGSSNETQQATAERQYTAPRESKIQAEHAQYLDRLEQMGLNAKKENKKKKKAGVGVGDEGEAEEPQFDR